jgi:heme exporter protein D
MGGSSMDAERAAAVVADPAAYRGRLFRLRGWIEELSTFDPGARSAAHYRGRLRLEGGGDVWFTVVALAEARGVGDFVRIDGLFLKVFRGRGAAGTWVEAPMIVGPRAVQSFPELPPVTELALEALRFVEDDGLDGISGQPFAEYWTLISYARNVEPGAIDWKSAPVLDRDLILEVRQDGSRWRGVPIRIPPAELFDIWDQAQDENPLRIDKLVEGWAGNEHWARTTTGLIRVVGPFPRGDLRRGDQFTANAFFLRNFAYERNDGNLAIAPFFVLHSIARHVPRQDNTWTMIFTSIAMGLVIVVCLTFVGVMRDRKRTQKLQDELRRRRRARRAQPQRT